MEELKQQSNNLNIAKNYFLENSDYELNLLLSKDMINARGMYLNSNYQYKNEKINFSEETCFLLEKLYREKLTTLENTDDLFLKINKCKSLVTDEAILYVKKKTKQKVLK